MFEAKIYIVWQSAKGWKEIYAIFNNKASALHNAEIWRKEHEQMGEEFKTNFKVTEQTIYGESYPVICK